MEKVIVVKHLQLPGAVPLLQLLPGELPSMKCHAIAQLQHTHLALREMTSFIIPDLTPSFPF